MSGGAFVLSKYQANNGDIFPVRVQPETLTAVLGTANVAPAGTPTINLFARARKGRRRYGVGCRAVRIRTGATPPAGYAANQLLTVPVLTAAVYNALIVGATVTYLATACTVVGLVDESRK